MNERTDVSHARSLAAGLVALLVLVAAGAWLIGRYIDNERERDLQQWESRIGLVADTRVDAIEGWIKERLDDLQELADNASLQLYLWQTVQARDAATNTEPAQLEYLRNLILAAADRYGYAAAASTRIPANVPQQQPTGLALLDVQLRPVASTAGFPVLVDACRNAVQQALNDGKPQVGRLHLDEQDRAVLALVVPVFPVLGADGNRARKAIGAVLGIRSADQELFPLLRRGASFAEDNEALLLERRDDHVVYLSPTADGELATRRSIPLARAQLAAAAALRAPNGFGRYHNYRGREVLQASRPVAGVPWIVAEQVDARQALQASDARRRFLTVSLSLLLLLVAALTIAAWRHGSSVRARQQARTLHEQAQRLQQQTELLHGITDNIEALTLLLNEKQEILFANQATGTALGCRAHDLLGRQLAAALGPANGRELQPGLQAAQQSREPGRAVVQLSLGERRRAYQAGCIPIAHVGPHVQPVLLVLEDITALQTAQKRHADLLRKLIATLVHAMDLHDPYSAHHSSRMTEVANAIGRELRLSASDRRTLDMAATLANIGKVRIPREVLTKGEPLTVAEQELVRRHVQFGVALLEDLQFEGPVLDTIAQKQEHLDGSGYPQGRNAEQMTITGKILSLANAFVALVSPRAYRDAVPVRTALDRLMAEAGVKYDRHALAALYHLAENREDWSQWREP